MVYVIAFPDNYSCLDRQITMAVYTPHTAMGVIFYWKIGNHRKIRQSQQMCFIIYTKAISIKKPFCFRGEVK